MEGLTSAEAERRLQEDGPNKLDAPPKESFWKILITQTKSTLFLLTTTAAILFGCIGDFPKCMGMIAMVVTVCFLNAYGEYNGQDAANALAGMTAADAKAVRDGKEVDISPEELVVGDVIVVKMGDVVPADMVVLSAVDLQTNESVLTGEPHEISKTVQPKDPTAPFPSNMMYSMTSIVAGNGKGEVVATGMRTQVGLIAKRLQGNKGSVLSPLQRSLNSLGCAITVAVVFAAVIITLIGLATGYQNASHHCPPGPEGFNCRLADNLVRGVMMPVALVPHGLPFAVTVMLGLSMREMKRRNAVVTKSTAVDYLSATAVICTDKTGTLTEGKMTAQAVVGLCRPEPNIPLVESALAFYPLKGLNPNGGLFTNSLLSAEAKARMEAKFELIQRRSRFSEPGLPDWAADDTPEDDEACLDALMARAHLYCGYLNCYATTLSQDKNTGSWSTDGNMTEAAVKVAAAKGGLWDGEAKASALVLGCERIAELEVPFTSKRKMMATVHNLPEDRKVASILFGPGITHFAVLKGAPDRIMPKLSLVADLEGRNLIIPGSQLGDGELSKIEELNKDFARRALRSLLLAVRPLHAQDMQKIRAAPDADARLDIICSTTLTFMTLWGIYDPPRAQVLGSVRECHTAGIRVVMITGDQQNTALAIARQVGIAPEGHRGEMRAATCTSLHHGQPNPVPPRRASMLSQAALKKIPAVSQEKLAAPQEGTEKEKSETDMTGEESEDTKRKAMLKQKLVAGVRKAGYIAAVSRGLEVLKLDAISKPFEQELPPTVHDDRSDKDEHEPSYKDPEQLAMLTQRVNVWARAQPTDKVAIVESLTEQGFIAAMTGDGVNDAPALKRASVGVSMGIAGTEVTKNAADLVLMDDDFSTIVTAVREGRRIYLNTQKYVLANMSLKFGECATTLLAICLHIHLPITPMQQMLNMPLTHSLCTMPFAWEEAESYIMKVPPRPNRTDYIVPKMMWLWRCIPFVVSISFLSCLNVWLSSKAHTGWGFTKKLVPTSKPGEVSRDVKACEGAGVLNKDNVFVMDRQVFHCKCYVHAGGMIWGDTVHVEQWGKVGGLHEILARQAFDEWTGDTSDVFTRGNTPWRDGIEYWTYECQDKDKAFHYCWREKWAKKSEDQRPNIPAGYSCVSWGLRAAGTMSYVTIQVGEILCVLTYRCDDFSLPKFFSNPVYVLALIANLSALYVFLYVPIVRDTLGFVPLEAPKMIFSLVMAFMVVALNEIWKIFYRARLAAQNEVLSKEALDAALRIPGEELSANYMELAQTPASTADIRKQYGQMPGLGPGRPDKDLEKGNPQNGEIKEPLLDASKGATPAWGAANRPVNADLDAVGEGKSEPGTPAARGLNMATIPKMKRAASKKKVGGVAIPKAPQSRSGSSPRDQRPSPRSATST